MRHVGLSKLLFLLASTVAISLIAAMPPAVYAAPQYRVVAFPVYSQEGSTITIVLTVSGAAPNTPYRFEFAVRNPNTTWFVSNQQQYTTLPGETEFSIIILFPSPEFPAGASTSLVGTYLVGVNQISPVPPSNPVATTFFFVGITDKTTYDRTETVSIIATAYQPFESVTVNIRTTVSLTVVHNANIFASNTGQVVDSWYVPKNATTTESYIVTVTGTVTSKNPADAQGFDVKAAIMSIPNLTSSKSTYQRTETMAFSFQASYPSGEMANTGLGLIILARPDGVNITLTANYNSTSQTFTAKYKTTATNQTGTWTATLSAFSYDDGFQNAGPDTTRTNSPQLQPATFSVSVTTKTTFAPFEQIRFNATIQYPDAVNLQSGNVNATLSFSGGGYTRTFSAIFDTALQLWTGTYSPQGTEPSGLWSLTVTGSDTATPANSGSSTRAITIQNRPPTATFTGSTSNAPSGTSVSFNSSGSSDSDGNIVSYLWDYGDGSTGSGATSTHSYAVPGTYTVRLTVTDNGGLTASSTQTVTITAGSQSGDILSLPLFYFAILAGALAAAIGGGIYVLRRHKVTHARLKIDLEAVRTEAGRIENQEFFQSVKDQLKKDKDD